MLQQILYIQVFEYVEHTLLDEMDSFPHGLNAVSPRIYSFQCLSSYLELFSMFVLLSFDALLGGSTEVHVAASTSDGVLSFT